MKFYGKILACTLGMSILAGCMSIPSRYDDNESSKIVDIHHNINMLDCSRDEDLIFHVQWIDHEIDWLISYTEFKKSRDILEMLELMKTTTEGMAQREQISETFCNLKKVVLQEQSAQIAKAIMGRVK